MTTATFHSRFNIARHTLEASTPTLRLACNVYTSKTEKNTESFPPILFTHANGFHKEVWEPIIERMNPRWTRGQLVAFDCRNQGDSYVLNKAVLGDVFDWYEYASDILKVVEDLNLMNVIAIGHSFGASAFVLAEKMRPGTFSTIIAIDPTNFPAELYTNPPLSEHPLAQGALRRKDQWKDRTEARVKLLEKKFFQSWHPELLESYLEYGMLDITLGDGTSTSSSAITLKCPKFQEAITFACVGTGLNDAFEGLADLTIPVHFLTGEESAINAAPLVEMKVNKCKRPSLDVVPGTGHLLTMEKPDECAQLISAYLGRFWAETHGGKPLEQQQLKARL